MLWPVCRKRIWCSRERARSDEAFHTLAVTLGVDDRLHMLGALPADDIADLYAAADLFVFPSTWETFGLAAVEAAMVGMPMVVADLPVLHEVLRADGTEPVAFVAPNNVEGWISAIGKALTAPLAGAPRRASMAPSRAPSAANIHGNAWSKAISVCSKPMRGRIVAKFAGLHTAVEEARP